MVADPLTQADPGYEPPTATPSKSAGPNLVLLHAARPRVQPSDEVQHPLREPSSLFGTLQEYMEEFKALHRLPDCWDGYLAPRPNATAIQDGIRAVVAGLRKSLLAERILPSVEGGVSVVFSTLQDRYADIELSNDREWTASVAGPGKNIDVWEVDQDSLPAAIDKIDRFLNER